MLPHQPLNFSVSLGGDGDQTVVESVCVHLSVSMSKVLPMVESRPEPHIPLISLLF